MRPCPHPGCVGVQILRDGRFWCVVGGTHPPSTPVTVPAPGQPPTGFLCGIETRRLALLARLIQQGAPI